MNNHQIKIFDSTFFLNSSNNIVTDMEKRSTPELLAPAGSMDSLKAAVNAGADSVYLSGKGFGARAYAENFNQVQMAEAVEFAHLKGVKVYITVNTLIRDGELLEVAEYLIWLHQIGADAVILQDMGTTSLCRRLIPDMELHASTQMTINSAEGVKWAFDNGFKRVILARELTLPEIGEIIREIDGKVELEIFAHGALCYSYSGQCLLSAVIGGRSGNRGKCAQPCRKPYQLLKGRTDKFGNLARASPIPTKENYILSTRDLSLYPELDKIVELPITSLKIEGRMRSPEYVAIVVSTYRKALDDLKNNKWVGNKKEISRLKLAFNRGFTRGYLLENNSESVMGREAPGNRGLYLGKVGKRTGGQLLIKLDPDLPDFALEKGDGIVFVDPESNLKKYGMAIENQPEYINPHKLVLKLNKNLPLGSKVYLTRDHSLTREAKNIIEKDNIGPYTPLDIKMELDENNIPILMGKFTRKDYESFDVYFKADFSLEPAKNRPLSKKQIINQLKKTGGTPFQVKNVEINYNGKLFTPLSKLNNLRREFIKKAQEILLDSYKPTDVSIYSAQERLLKVRRELKKKLSNPSIVADRNSQKPLEISVYTSNLEALQGALKGGSKRVYFEPSVREHFNGDNPCKKFEWTRKASHIYDLLLEAQELCTAQNATLIWKWPSVTSAESIRNLKKLMEPLYNTGLSEVMVGNMGAFRAINKLNLPMKICGCEALNIWNHLSFNQLSEGFDRLTLSNELSKRDLSDLLSYNNHTRIPVDLVVQGNLDSLITEDCLLKAAFKWEYINQNDGIKNSWYIEDGKHRTFPVIIDDETRTHIKNSVELCLINYIPYLNQIGLHALKIDARNKTSSYANLMVKYYIQGLNFKEINENNIHKLNILKNKVKKISGGGITTGNFLK